MLVGSFLDYLRYGRSYSEKAVPAYDEDISQLQGFVQEEIGKFNPLEVGPGLIREWIVLLMDREHTSASVNRKLSSLRSSYKYLLRQGEVGVDPLHKAMGSKNKKPFPSFLKENEMNKLLDDANLGGGFKGRRDHSITEAFYTIGMRLSELTGLDDRDIDFSTSLLKVAGKRNKQRLAPFGDESKKAMFEYVDVENKVISVESDAFFVRENGERPCKNPVYSLMKRNLPEVVTLKKRNPRVLRHTFAITMLNNDAGLGAVKELLGRSSLATTEIYMHTIFGELKKAYKQVHPQT